MKKLGKILGFFFLFVILAVALLLGYVKTQLPKAEKAPNVTIELTESRLQRGAYLFNHGAACISCHSERDHSLFAYPIVEETAGKGGEAFDQSMGFPGAYYAANLTPYNLKSWTDGEIYRAITSGISKDGHALFPIMPYHNYGKMSQEDIYSIIAYMRTLPSIAHDVPKSSSDFPMNFIINLIPKPGKHQPAPDKNNKIAYGEYVATMASCSDCHTPMKEGRPIPSMKYAGGEPFLLPTGDTVRSSNLTPDKATGLGNWTEDAFVNRFKAYADSAYVSPQTDKGNFNTAMPWTDFAHLEERDLRALFAYLQSLQPIENSVKRFGAANP